MRIYPAVSRFFYPPLVRISNCCTQKLRLFSKKIRSHTLDQPFAKSILGRIVICASAETIGAIAGKYIGAAILGWIGGTAGTILGGYWGLKATDSSVSFLDSTILCDCYLVGMSKFLLVGELFEATIVRATSPLIGPPINLVRWCVGLTFKSVAYSSNSVITACKDSVREKTVSYEVMLPLLAKIFCNRYCQTNSTPLTTKLVNTLNAFPNVKQLLRQSAIFEQLRRKVELLGNKGDLFTNMIMRSFHGYVKLFKSSKPIQTAYEQYRISPETYEKAFKDALKKEIQGARTLSLLFPKIGELSGRMIKTLCEAEQDLIGFPLTRETKQLKETLEIHLKYFALYTLSNYNLDPISAEEERDFMIDLNNVFFSIYNEPSYSHKTVRLIGKISRVSIQALFSFKKWFYHFIEQPAEKSVLHRAITLDENHIPRAVSTTNITETWENITPPESHT